MSTPEQPLPPGPGPGPGSEDEIQAARKKRTYLLLAGGALSLLLPLGGVVYLRMNEAGTARAPNSAVMFDRREGGEAKINVSQAVVIPAAGSGTSPAAAPGAAAGSGGLGFVKGSGDYFQDKKAEAPAVSTQAAAAPAPAPAPEPPKAASKKGAKKAFSMPHLTGTKSFSNFKANPKAGAGGPGGGSADMMKNLPPGAENNPDIQKLLKSQGK